jgi:hypothetical protein
MLHERLSLILPVPGNQNWCDPTQNIATGTKTIGNAETRKNKHLLLLMPACVSMFQLIFYEIWKI